MYTIIIDEDQRQALLDLLNQDQPDPRLEYWVEMLTELPDMEAANPGIHHGFCL